MKLKTLPFSILLTGLVLVYFGLRTKGFRPINHVTSINGGSGLAFGRQGIAYTRTPRAGVDNPLRRGELTLNFFFEPGLTSSNYLTYLVSLWSPGSDHFVSICQWQDQILVLRHHKHSLKNAPHVGFRIKSKTRRMLTITSDCSKGTRIYLDGVSVSSSKTLKLICGKPPPERISLGNSPKGNRGWRGKIWSFSLLDRSLTATKVTALAEGIQKTIVRRPTARRQERSRHSLNTSAPPLFQAPAYFGELQIPKWMQGPYREFLLSPWDNRFDLDSYAMDMVLNFLAFIPWGFLWALLFYGRGFGHIGSLLWATAAAITMSFVFETVQYFIPTRTTQLTDLILNGVGGLLGGGLALVYRTLTKKARS